MLYDLKLRLYLELYWLENWLCGQSYKASTSVNYDSTVVITSKLLIFKTLEL